MYFNKNNTDRIVFVVNNTCMIGYFMHFAIDSSGNTRPLVFNTELLTLENIGNNNPNEKLELDSYQTYV